MLYIFQWSKMFWFPNVPFSNLSERPTSFLILYFFWIYFNFVFLFVIVFVWGPDPAMLRGHSCLCTQKLVWLTGKTCKMPRNKPGSVLGQCKENALPTVLSLQPLSLFYIIDWFLNFSMSLYSWIPESEYAEMSNHDSALMSYS